jgi:predicted phosphodiesterase
MKFHSDFLSNCFFSSCILDKQHHSTDWYRYVEYPNGDNLIFPSDLLPDQPLCSPTSNCSSHLRILMMSDTHNRHSCFTNLPKCDIFIHCGDILMMSYLFSFNDSIKKLQDFNQWLASIPAKKKFIIGGNHDSLLMILGREKVQEILSNAIYLENQEFSYEIDIPFDPEEEKEKERSDDNKKGVNPTIQSLNHSEKKKTKMLTIWGSPISCQGKSQNIAFQSKEFHEKTLSSLSSSSSIDIILTHGYPDQEILSKFPSHSLHVYGHAHNHYGIKYHPVSSSLSSAQPQPAATAAEKEDKSTSFTTSTIEGKTSRFDQVYQFKEEGEGEGKEAENSNQNNNRFSSQRTVVIAASKKPSPPSASACSAASSSIPSLSLCVPVTDGHYQLTSLPMILDFPISMISEKKSFEKNSNLVNKDSLGVVAVVASRSSSSYLTEKEEDEITAEKRKNNSNNSNQKRQLEEEKDQIVEKIKIKPDSSNCYQSHQTEVEDAHADDGSGDPSFSVFRPLFYYFTSSSGKSSGKKKNQHQHQDQQQQQSNHKKHAVHQPNRHYYKVFPVNKQTPY